MRVRRFTQADYSAVLDIYSKVKLDELRYENNNFELLPLEQDTVRLAALLESDIYLYGNGKILGYGAIYKSEIRALFVLSENRGVGVGKALLEYLLSKASGEVSLHVASSNYLAKSLYESYDFNVTETFETSYNGIAVLANTMIRTINTE